MPGSSPEAAHTRAAARVAGSSGSDDGSKEGGAVAASGLCINAELIKWPHTGNVSAPGTGRGVVQAHLALAGREELRGGSSCEG